MGPRLKLLCAAKPCRFGRSLKTFLTISLNTEKYKFPQNVECFLNGFTNRKTSIALKMSQFYHTMYFTGCFYSIYGQQFSQLGGIFQRLPHLAFIMSTGQRISHLFFITIIVPLWIGYTSTSTNSEYYTLIYYMSCCYSYRYCAIILTGILLLFLQVLCCYSYRYFAVILTVIVLLFLQLFCCYFYSYCDVILTATVLLFLQLLCYYSYSYCEVILTVIVLLFLQLFCCCSYSYCAVVLTAIVKPLNCYLIKIYRK
jgi:hypothetical protein